MCLNVNKWKYFIQNLLEHKAYYLALNKTKHTYPHWFCSYWYKGLNTHKHAHDTVDLVQKVTKTEVTNLKKLEQKYIFCSMNFHDHHVGGVSS